MARLQTSDDALIDARHVVCQFGAVEALRGVSLTVRKGHIHALLGPNGAGKTTLLRVLTGAVVPTTGEVTVGGRRPDLFDAHGKQLISVAPAGDRSFYVRLSGLENLVFFGRMHGLRRGSATARARTVLEGVGLDHVADRQVGTYSQGMKKRLSVARALLTESRVLVMDEATHDVDTEGAVRIRELAMEQTRKGAAVVWATQKLDEIRGFAHAVTVLHRGTVCFQGTVSDLVEHAATQRFLVRLAPADSNDVGLMHLRALVGPAGEVDPTPDADHVYLALRDGVVLGDVLASFTAANIGVLSCREEESLVEVALQRLTAEPAPVPATATQ